MLSGPEAKTILAAYGIPTGRTQQATTEDEAVFAAEQLGYPVAIKILSHDITHKSDVGGVALEVATSSQVRQVFRDMLKRARTHVPDARIIGVTVEPMASLRDAREVLIGMSQDPTFGPVIAFGSGGTAVEVHKDRALALPPLTPEIARRMMARTRVDRMLDRFRDLDGADREAVVDAILRVSELVVDLPEIRSLDINPLLAGPDGVLAIDARIELD